MAEEVHDANVIAEINKNQAAFDSVREEMEIEHLGKTVLMHDGSVVAVYYDQRDAYAIGCEKFGLGAFSLHVVGQRPVDLGFQAIPLTLRG